MVSVGATTPQGGTSTRRKNPPQGGAAHGARAHHRGAHNTAGGGAGWHHTAGGTSTQGVPPTRQQRAPDVVSGKSSHSLALARSAGGHGRKGTTYPTTYPTSSSSSVCVCLLPRRGAPDPGWLVCAGPPAAAQSLRLRPRATDEACKSLPTVGVMGGHSGTRASG